MGNYRGLALAPLQNFTYSRRHHSPAITLGLNTTFHTKNEHMTVLLNILQKGEKGERMDPLSIRSYYLRPSERQ